MSPLAGRFLGRDPIGYVYNNYLLYLYVKNCPFNYLDPDGKCALGAGIGAALSGISTLLSSWLNGESTCQIGCKSFLNTLNGAFWGCVGTSGLPPCLTAVFASITGTAIGTICDSSCNDCWPTRTDLACNFIGAIAGAIGSCLVTLGGQAHEVGPGIIAGLEAAIGAIIGDDAVKICNLANKK